jgi:hypothetical protein
MVSGTKKKVINMPVPDSAVWSQKIVLHSENVTMIPPMKGPNAGPINVPDRNHPIAVPRSTGLYMSLRAVSDEKRESVQRRAGQTYPIHADPTKIKDVPTKAENARNTKKEPRSGARAVARLSKKNDTDVTKFVWQAVSIVLCHPKS